MFIQKLVIEGFKSFSIPTSSGPFLPGINILVEDNDSGRTSIFDVIEFVFNDEFANVEKDKLKNLIYNDTEKEDGNSIIIEIFFDNSDKKFENHPATFSIKRLTNLNEDYYVFDEKKMLREEFIELFRKLDIDIFTDVSILKQNKVIRFAMASDNERLYLLFKIIGCEKLKPNKLNTSIEKKDKASMEDNKCYDKLKEESFCCEKCKIENEKLMRMEEKIAPLEKKLKDWLTKQRNDKLKYDELTNEFMKLESKLIRINKRLELLKNIEKEVTIIINELEDYKSLLEISIIDNIKKKEENERTLQKMNKELEFLRKEIMLEENIIQSMKSELSTITINVVELTAKYEEELWELDCLHLKLSKNEPISTEEKEKSIHKIMEVWQKSSLKKRKYLEDYPRQREEKNKKKIELTNNILSIKTKLENLKTLQENHSKESEMLQDKIKITTDASRNVATKKDEVSKRLRLLQDHYNENGRKLISAVKCDVINNRFLIENALESFNKESKNEINDSTYHGFVIDCFQCPPEIEAAIIAVAGQYLFNFVFDCFRDTLKISRKMDDKNDLSFMSLDRLKPMYKTLPNSPHAFPLIAKIRYAPVYEKLVEFMFGNILVCRDTQVAANLSNKNKITCVTLHGNLFLPNGVSITKSCNENGVNQMSIYKLMSEQLIEIKDKEREINKLCEEELSLKNTISEYSERINILELLEEHNEQHKTSLENELHKLESELRLLSVDEHEEIEDSMNMLTTKVKEFELRLYHFDQEEMTPEHNRRYEELKISTTTLLKQWEEVEKKADELDRKITLKENALEESYLKWEKDLQKKIQEITEEIEKENNLIKNYEIDLESKVLTLKEEYKKQNEHRLEIEKLTEEIQEMISIKQQKDNEAQQLTMSINKNDTVMKHLEHKYNEIRKILEETQSKIDKCSYSVESKSIEKLIVYKKFIEINNNLKNIIKRFRPHGDAELIFMINNNEYAVNEINDLDLGDFTGVSIKFSESTDCPARNMDELSVKQKTIITLALFFAILKSNSTPIILCDKIDQVFDNTCRQILSKIIKEMSSKAQIFLATSSPELLQTSDHFIIM